MQNINSNNKVNSFQYKTEVSCAIALLGIALLILSLYLWHEYASECGKELKAYDMYRAARHAKAELPYHIYNDTGVYHVYVEWGPGGMERALYDHYAKLETHWLNENTKFHHIQDDTYLIALCTSVLGGLLLLGGIAGIVAWRRPPFQQHGEEECDKNVPPQWWQDLKNRFTCTSTSSALLITLIGATLITLSILLWIQYANTEVKELHLTELHYAYGKIDASIYQLPVYCDLAQYNRFKSLLQQGMELAERIGDKKVAVYEARFDDCLTAVMGSAAGVAGLSLILFGAYRLFRPLPGSQESNYSESELHRL